MPSEEVPDPVTRLKGDAMASERRRYDTKTSIRHAHLTLGDIVDRPARSVKHFANNECVRRRWPCTCSNAGWKAVEGGKS